MTIGERIRSERERLGMSQPQFAQVADTTKQTLFSWETGRTSPNASQLAALAEAGVDVVYVVTGDYKSVYQAKVSLETMGVADNGAYLDGREAQLLTWYRAASDEGKRAIEAVARALAGNEGDDETA